jgi:hypothetical protein
MPKDRACLMSAWAIRVNPTDGSSGVPCRDVIVPQCLVQAGVSLFAQAMFWYQD